MDLKEWTRIFLKQRDLLKREIEKIEENKRGFLVHLKSGKERVVIVEDLLADEEGQVLVCLNRKENVRTLVKHWEHYAAQEDLLMVFASPSTNEKWLIKPHHHAKIADEESFEQGLLAMYEAITAA